MENSLSVWTSQAHWSFDPYEFDYSAHHITQPLVVGKLFTSYKDSITQPSIAQRWESANAGREWKIFLRPDVKFSSGRPIDSRDAYASVKRVLLLAKRRGSRLPLLMKISGKEHLISMDQPFEGLSYGEGFIRFRLNEAENNLPDILAFGIFGIVPREKIDTISLKIDQNEFISSGPYEIVASMRGATEVNFIMRSDYPKDFSAESAARSITVSWDRGRRNDSDVIDGFRDEDSPNSRMLFFGNTGSDVVFLQCFSYARRRSKFSDEALRRYLRDSFYERLRARGVFVKESLYPFLDNPSAQEFVSAVYAKNFLENVLVKFRPPRNLQVPSLLAIKEAFVETFSALGAKVDLQEDLGSQDYAAITSDSTGVSGVLDFGVRGTTIGAEHPVETTRLMFSKEGINLPDPSGSISALLDSSNQVELGLVDRHLSKDAIVWPVLHHSNGFWVSERVDISRYNTALPLSELQWIGLK